MHMRKAAVVTATASLLFVSGFGAGQLAPIKASESATEPAQVAPAVGSGSTARLPSFDELSARVSLSAGWDILPQLSLHLLGGVALAGEVRLEDHSGRKMSDEDYDPAPYVGLRVLTGI